MKKLPLDFPLASELPAFKEKWDLHCHTTFVDGLHSVNEMILQAEVLGISVFAITEHVRSSAAKWWMDYVNEIKEHRQVKNIKVLIGMEANAIGVPGNVDVTEEMWKEAELVLGSIHGYYDKDWNKIKDGSLAPEKAMEYEIEKAIGLCRNDRIHVLAHPAWLYEKHYGAFPEDAMKLIIKEAKITGTAIEINGHYLNDVPLFFKIIREVNPFVSFGSNAHSATQLCFVLDQINKEYYAF